MSIYVRFTVYFTLSYLTITTYSILRFSSLIWPSCHRRISMHRSSYGPSKETRYDYNLTIMKSPKLANDCFRRHHVEELQTCSPGHASDT